MLLCTTASVRQVSRRVALLALLLPAGCDEAPAPNSSPFYLAPSAEPALSPEGREVDQLRQMKQPGDASSMQNMPATGPYAPPSASSPGGGSASFGTGSPASSGGE